jgi:pimeloyl-ACP methyl ester carboxylesterase
VSGSLRRRANYLRFLAERRLKPERVLGAADGEAALSLDMDAESRTLLLAFGGMKGSIGIPPFEFLSLTGEIPVKRLFVRDLRQAWYHRGVPGHGETVTAVADSLAELLAQHEVERLVVTGNSAGGYAALLFGALLGADAVLCFAPQTILDPDVLARIGDHRWDVHLLPLVASDGLDRRYADLGAVLPELAKRDTVYKVFFDETLGQDRAHAERLLDVPGVRLYRFGAGGHHLVRSLRDSGALARLLQQALALEVPAR